MFIFHVNVGILYLSTGYLFLKDGTIDEKYQKIADQSFSRDKILLLKTENAFVLRVRI